MITETNKTVKGAGSGEQHVREQYAAEVRALRARLTRTRSCLIAMIDADTGSTHARRIQFEQALRDTGEDPKQSDEPIANLVAKRSVETWILCLNREVVDGGVVNEDTSYRRHQAVTPSSITQAALTMYQTRQNAIIPATCVLSLRESLPEFQRIP